MDLMNGKNINFDKLFDELDKDSNGKFDPNKKKILCGTYK